MPLYVTTTIAAGCHINGIMVRSTQINEEQTLMKPSEGQQDGNRTSFVNWQPATFPRSTSLICRQCAWVRPCTPASKSGCSLQQSNTMSPALKDCDIWSPKVMN